MSKRSAVIVGGGIVGLATAHQLADRGWDVQVLEKEPRVGMHQSGRNSGVIHSGVYYTPGSVKAETCAAGRQLLEEYCDSRGILWRRCGKVIVAVDEEERGRLGEIERRGRANGVACERIDRRKLHGIEPHIAGVEALWVPEAGVVDYGQVCNALADDIEAGGGSVRTNTEVRGIRTRRDGVLVETEAGDMLAADAAVNCGGLWSDRLAEASDGAAPPVHILPFRGEYHQLGSRAACHVKGLVYPVPDPRFPFLGVHLTRHIDHRVTAGPNAVLALARDGYTWQSIRLGDLFASLRSKGLRKLARRYPVTGLAEMWRSLNRRAFLAAAQRLMPSLQLSDLRPHRAGVRAQAIDPDGSLADDFRLLRRPRVVHVLNAPSPAATACLAIGDRVAEALTEACSGSS